MSKRIISVTLLEFGYLLEYARIIHKDKNEPIPELGQDNWDKVDFALQAPAQTAFGLPIYRGFIKKASALFYFLAKGHRLANGNKRMACVTLDYFCGINERDLVISDDALLSLARYTASSDPMDKDECIRNIQAILKKCIQKRTKT